MKIGGVDPQTLPTEEVLVLPRGDQVVVFRAKGVPDVDEFDRMCPEPKPPGKLTKDGYVPDLADPDYRSVLGEYFKRRTSYIVVRSLEPSQIEWDSVKMSDPSTWANWTIDLKKAGFSQMACNRILELVLEANCLDEAKLKKAREVFLQGPPQGQQA